VQQENVNHGWQVPPQPEINNDGPPRPVQEGALVGENELAAANNWADMVVANAIANGPMQHPDRPQHSESVSSDVLDFYRAQGAPVTLELPLPTGSAYADGALFVPGMGTQNFDNDYFVRDLANRLGLHQGFGPSPSVQMLLQDLAQKTKELQAILPMKTPLPATSWNFIPSNFVPDTWFLGVDNPNWGDNASASTSSGYKRPRLELIRNENSSPLVVEPEVGPEVGLHAMSVNGSDNTMGHGSDSSLGQARVPYDQNFAINQILNNLHPQSKEFVPTIQLGGSSLLEPYLQQFQPDMDVDMELDNDEILTQPEEEEEGANVVACSVQAATPKKRKGRGKTPIVDDEVRRCPRFKKNGDQVHVFLNSETRRKKGEAKKTVSISIVEDLKAAIVTRSLEAEMEEVEVEPIQACNLVELGTSFCGVPSMELSIDTLLPDEEE